MFFNKLSRKVIVPAMVATLFVGASATANAASICNTGNVANLSKTKINSMIKDYNAKLVALPSNTSLKSNVFNIVKDGNGYKVTLNNEDAKKMTIPTRNCTNPGTVIKDEDKEPAPAPKPTEPSKPEETPEKPAEPSKPEETPEKPSEPSKPEETTPESNNQGLSAEEAKMVELVNQARAEAGLKPLTVDTSLANVARIKSKDMHDNKYFSHQSPTYGSPFDMMREFGIQYRGAAENIAKNSSVQAAHTSLMNSEGHRRNILNPSYTHIGIGIYNGYYTQMFISK